MIQISKLKEKLEDRTIEILFALIGLLCLIIWRAVPSEVWERISGAVPTQALWAMIGLLLIVASAEAAYIIHLRRQKDTKLSLKFGAYWDKQNNVYCPSCQTLLQHRNRLNDDTVDFRCIKCKDLIKLTDEKGYTIYFKEAKERLRLK
jgi:hypothetical protein